MIQKNGNIVSINKTVKLSKKQELKLKSMSDSIHLPYILTLMGQKNRNIHVNYLIKSRGPEDRLSNKRVNSIGNKFQKLLDNESSTNHSPDGNRDKSQWVGVEIECYIDGLSFKASECEFCCGSGSYEDDDGEETTCGECDGSGRHEDRNGNSILEDLRFQLNESKITRCSVRRDGSLDDDNGGVEITFLFNAARGFTKLEKLCKILNNFGAKVNSDCGLHIHLDYYNYNQTYVNTFGCRMAEFLPIVSQFVPKSRRENDYCKMVASNRNRYSAINMTAFSKHQTIEIRLHSGTTNFEKIKHWIELWSKIKEVCMKPLKSEIETFQELIDTLKLPDYLTEFYDRRMTKFGNRTMEYITDTNSATIDVSLDDNENAGVDAA